MVCVTQGSVDEVGELGVGGRGWHQAVRHVTKQPRRESEGGGWGGRKRVGGGERGGGWGMSIRVYFTIVVLECILGGRVGLPYLLCKMTHDSVTDSSSSGGSVVGDVKGA